MAEQSRPLSIPIKPHSEKRLVELGQHVLNGRHDVIFSDGRPCKAKDAVKRHVADRVLDLARNAKNLRSISYAAKLKDPG